MVQVKTVCQLISGLVLLYIIWVVYWRKSVSNQSWKTREFVNVPVEIIREASDIQIQSKLFTLKLEEKDLKIHYLETLPSDGSRDIHILLLHGQGDSSEVWRKIGTLKFVAAMGYRAVAMDLPGSGTSMAMKVDKIQLLDEFIHKIQLKSPVIIAPSMAGSWALPFLLQNPEKCQDKAGGLVTLAPVWASKFSKTQYINCKIPVMIAYGTSDERLGVGSAKYLRHFPNSREVLFQDGGHACFIDDPEYWHFILYNYLITVT